MTFVKFVLEVVGSAAAATVLLAGVIKALMSVQHKPGMLAGVQANAALPQTSKSR